MLLQGILGFLGARGEAKAAKQAGDLSYKASQEAIAEQRRQFDVMRGYLDPVYQDSRAASGLYMTALGIPQGAGAAPGGYAPMPQGGSAGQPNWQGYLDANPDVRDSYAGVRGQFASPEAWGEYHYNTHGQGEGRQLPGYGQQGGAPQGGGQPAGSPSMTRDQIISMVRDTPGYQGQLQEGIGALDRAAAGGQGMTSGRRMMALNDYGQKTFGSYYDSWLNRVGGMAGQAGQTGAQIGQAGMQMAGNNGQMLMSGAQARGQAGVNSANAWSGFYGGVAGQLNSATRMIGSMYGGGFG